MGCRCSDIARCQNELSTMSGTVSSNLNNAVSCSTQISQALREAASNVAEAVNTDSIHEVETQLNILNLRGDELSQGLCGECGREIQRLSSLLKQMRSEDQDHHEAEEAAKTSK